ncbi:four helix bundle protein [Candidatus Kaiserbacteria bacterium]|nr:four helix bundle protein [Candidatus Kaiserbacteria bacterium]
MITRSKDLLAWKKAHALVLALYNLTKQYPREELYGLTSQSRRAAVSISSNIAEGFGRGTRKDKLQFYAIARTSLAELENQLLIALDLKYVSQDDHRGVSVLTGEVTALIVGLERSAVDKRTQI